MIAFMISSLLQG